MKLAYRLPGAEPPDQYTDPSDKIPQLQVLQALGLPEYDEQGAFSHVIAFEAGKLCLRQLGPQAPAPTCVDFSSAAIQHRLQTMGKKQGVARAVGLHQRSGLSILDATAGLGRDAFILAALGCRVTMLERQPWVYALLADGLRRAARADGELREIVARMRLFQAEGLNWCRDIVARQEDRPDVIYLDPMFPVRRKRALVKKDMASLQSLLGPDEDVSMLLAVARQAAIQRVVVKRPGGKGDTGLAPCDFQVSGKSSHFDIYLSAPQGDP